MAHLVRLIAGFSLLWLANSVAAQQEDVSRPASGDRKPAKAVKASGQESPSGKLAPPRKLGPKAAGVCPLLDPIAKENGLPPLFFARLIWQESRFNELAVSPKGAQGIAQFMPATAALRRLDDPFEPKSALAASAAYLADLRAAFGNLGLAAAAYNAGANRVRKWLAGETTLPAETLDYVWTITGRPPIDWKDGSASDKDLPRGKGPPSSACQKLASLLTGTPADTELAAKQPWGVQIAGGFSKSRTLASFNRLKKQFSDIIGERKPILLRTRRHNRGRRALYQARIGAGTRAEAQKLCMKLRARGGACVVLHN